MGRPLDKATLDQAAIDYAAMFLQPSVKSPSGAWVSGPERIQQDFYAFDFKDEFEYLLQKIRQELGKSSKARLDAIAEKTFSPRDDRTLEKLLAEKLAVDLNGDHIEGRVGTVQIGARVVGKRLNSRGFVKNLYWPIYAGEGEERSIGSSVVDSLPEGAEPLPVGALNTRISNECAILACDSVVDNLDEGTGAAVIQGRSGTQPADPDTTVTGTLLFTLVCSDPAFGAAADAAPGATATASSITDDSSADATGTLGYCRASATNDGATPLDDHIDGEAGTSGADFNFNTLSIVSGATVSMTSWTVTMPES